jgi:hypothetical protein
MTDSLTAYGQLLAWRYVQCAEPLAPNPAAPLPAKEGLDGLCKNDLEFISGVVSLGLEMAGGHRDRHGRLNEERTPHGREAAVDDLLARTLEPCPERRFTVLVTHDVDRTTPWEATALLKRLGPPGAGGARSPLGSIPNFRRAIEKTVDDLVRFETDNEIGAIYFFLSGPYSLARHGSRTSVTFRSSRAILRAVQAAGMEVGLHGSYYANDRRSYADECARLADAAGVAILHHRNHYLRYDPAALWGELVKAGIAFDHSAGFAAGWGFRTGTCVPYPAYDLAAHAVSRVIEVPMVLMDGTWSETHDAGTLAAIRASLETVRRHRGCVSINFHPESLATVPTTWEYFRRIVQMCKDMGAVMGLKGFV